MRRVVVIGIEFAREQVIALYEQVQEVMNRVLKPPKALIDIDHLNEIRFKIKKLYSR